MEGRKRRKRMKSKNKTKEERKEEVLFMRWELGGVIDVKL